MGITITQIEQEYLGRIRTKRSRKRAAIKDKDKRLIGMYKEEKKLSKQKYELPMIDLIPPVQKGWKRYFILRDDVRRSKDAVFYENLLQKINTYQYSAEKVFKKKKRKAGKRIYVEIKQELKMIYPYELSKLKLSDDELACFEYQNIPEIRGRKIYDKYAYVFKEPWRFVLRIRPNIVYKIQAIDEELEQRIDELNDILFENHTNFGRLSQLKSWKNNRDWNDSEMLKYKNPIKNIPLYQLVEKESY